MPGKVSASSDAQVFWTFRGGGSACFILVDKVLVAHHCQVRTSVFLMDLAFGGWTNFH